MAETDYARQSRIVLKQQGERLLLLENEVDTYCKQSSALTEKMKGYMVKHKELEDRVKANETSVDQQDGKLMEIEKALQLFAQLRLRRAEKEAQREGWRDDRSAATSDIIVPGLSLDTTVTTLQMPDYQELCQKLLEWRSPCMYTHTGGYKICLRVAACKDSGIGKKSLVFDLLALPGEFDDRLRWPARSRFIFEILNQEEQGDLVFVSAMNSWIQPEGELSLQFTNLKNLDDSYNMVDCQKLSGFVNDNSLEFRLTKLPELF